MKSSTVWIISLFIVSFTQFADAALAPLDPKKMERQFIELIVNGHKLPLDPTMHPGCKKTSRSVGELYSRIMNEYLFGEGTDKKLLITCKSYEATNSLFKAPRKNETPVECTIQNDWKTENGVGKLALVARITRNGKALERKYLACEIAN